MVLTKTEIKLTERLKGDVMSRLTFENMVVKERTVEITRSDFAKLHNNTMYALSQLAMATNDNRGMTAEETMEVFKLIYPIVNGLQDVAVENGFGFCI